MKRAHLPLVYAVLPLLAGCALCEQLTADRIVAGTILFTPTVDEPRTPEIERPAATELTVFVGTLASPTDEPKPHSGAQVRIVFPLAPEGIALVEDAETPGVYRLPEDAGPLAFLEGQEYRLEVSDETEDYAMRVTTPLSGGSPVLGGEAQPHRSGTPLTLPNPDPNNLTFVTVSRSPDPISGDGVDPCLEIEHGTTYSDLPEGADDALDLIQDDGRWRKEPLVIPPEAFPGCGLYTVLVGTVGRGVADTTNLFIGSQFFAGSASGALYRVR